MALSPASSRGSSSGPTAGTYLPVAKPSGVTVDTTTYDNPFGSGKLTTLVFPVDDAALCIAIAGDAFPRWLLTSNGRDGMYFGDGTADVSNGAYVLADGAGANRGLGIPPPTAGSSAAQIGQVSPKFRITAGALPVVTCVSGVGRQIDTSTDVETRTDITTDATNNIASCEVELSPDNVTYSSVSTVLIAAAVNTLGQSKFPMSVRVPAGWYLRLTLVHAVMSTTAYY